MMKKTIWMGIVALMTCACGCDNAYEKMPEGTEPSTGGEVVPPPATNPAEEWAALADSCDLAASCIGVWLVKQPGDAARGTKNDRVVEVVLAGLVDAVDAIFAVVHAVVWCRPGARQGIDCECHGIGIGDEVFD